MENNAAVVDDSNTSEQVENLIVEGGNKFPVSCARCRSKILNTGSAEFEEIQFSLPMMTLHKDRSKDSIDKENLSKFWMVRDKFTFENIGFSNTVSGIKYLICADCEIGPIGWFDPSSQFCYVSISRVKNQP